MPDMYSDYSEDFADERDFNATRHNIGNLMILTKDKNRSYQDMPYSEKVIHYDSDNILARSLNENCYKRNPSFLKMIEKMEARGISQVNIDMIKYYGIDFNAWLGGFKELDFSIKKTVELIKKHPLVPDDMQVYGLIMDSVTGELRKLELDEET